MGEEKRVEVGRKGGEITRGDMLVGVVLEVVVSNGGAGANVGLSVSWISISVSERTLSQGGGRMFARPWDFRRRASQRGISAGRGGRREGVVH